MRLLTLLMLLSGQRVRLHLRHIIRAAAAAPRICWSSFVLGATERPDKLEPCRQRCPSGIIYSELRFTQSQTSITRLSSSAAYTQLNAFIFRRPVRFTPGRDYVSCTPTLVRLRLLIISRNERTQGRPDALMSGFHHSVAVLPLPFRRCNSVPLQP